MQTLLEFETLWKLKNYKLFDFSHRNTILLEFNFKFFKLSLKSMNQRLSKMLRFIIPRQCFLLQMPDSNITLTMNSKVLFFTHKSCLDKVVHGKFEENGARVGYFKAS